VYPRQWRERYEREFLAFLQDRHLSIRAIFNVIGNALYERFVAFGHRRSIFTRYTETARRAFFFARDEATQLGSTSIEPEHLLLGVFRENSIYLDCFFADPSAIQAIPQETMASVRGSEKRNCSECLPPSVACKRILRYAQEEAHRLNARVGGEHFLIGILREEESHASEILRKHGMDLTSAREKLVQLSPRRTIRS
jgi:ATP-dependent Clp protease ATP-binding subunit ClpC